ncbi:MAG: hypothetical protein OEV55_08740, partial [candidate division Zixibacteria bacterium]|nr:hypothetical protein [candidate division Zixibacteria bacterium]
MIKRILFLIFILLFITSLIAFGAMKSDKAVDKKMAQRLEQMEKADYADGEVSTPYIISSDPKILFPATGDTAGYTYQDYQHNDCQRRQIAYSPVGPIVHTTWMNLVEEGGNRYMDYNSWDPFGGWLIAGGMHVTPAVPRGGYGGLDLLPDDREVLCYHRWEPVPGLWATTISLEQVTPGLGELNAFDIPDSVAGSSAPGTWPVMAISKQLRGDTAFMHITHAERQTAGSVDKGSGYVRCFEKPGNIDTLVCQSPGWSSALKIPKNTKLAPNKVPYRVTTARLGVIDVATSPVSENVALTWLQNYESNQTQNELMYVESTNNGDDWMSAGYMTPIKLTSYEGTDIRAYDDLAIVYDYENGLHIMWTTFPSTNSNDVSLWHWNPSTGIRKASAATASTSVDPGVWNLIIAKFTLGVWPDSDYLYITYTKFKDGDISAAEYANGDLCVRGSTNGGLTWGPEVNMTNTNTNGCTAGNCLSEHWSSMAEIVNDSLHILYIEDKDAGGVAQTEGDYTNNAVRYLRYARPSIPAAASIAYTPASMNAPFLWATNGGNTSDTMTFDNTGTSTLYVTLSGPSWLTINPNTFSIAEAGAAQEVYLTFNGASFNDTLIIDSMMVASNNGVNGLVYSDTDMVGIHFVVTDEFYRVEYDTCDYSPITQVSNMGNLGSQDFDSVGMFYKGNNYLFEFSPVFVTGDLDGLGPVGFTWIHQDHND